MMWVLSLSLLGAGLAAAGTCPQSTRCSSAQGSYKDLPLKSSADCCDACVADADCAGWIYNDGQTPPTCHLKTSSSYITPCGTATCGYACGASAPPTPTPPAPPGAKNVLFIISDDMRPSLGAYGLPEAVTPNLDALAKNGIMFTRAHVQFSYCAPSRNSFMSGRRPDSIKVWNFLNHFREGEGENWTALPEHFKNHGYLTTGTGKLFHPGVPPNFDEPRSWSQNGPDGSKWPYLNQGKVNGTNMCNSSCCGVESYGGQFCLWDVKPGTFILDQTVKNIAVERLRDAVGNWKATKQPFFLGMGTHRPHLQWEFPKTFFDKISENVPEAKHKEWIADVPHLHYHECAEMSRQYLDTDGFGTPFSDKDFSGHQSLMRRAYYGCISYVDDLIGQLTTALRTFGAEQDTVVMFTGDHGWSLGEHDVWCKMTNNEAGTRVPLIISAPFLPKSKGVRSDALAELVDLFPTLAELAGVPVDFKDPRYALLGGTSLAPIFEGKAEQVKDVTLSQFPRCFQNNTHFIGPKTGDENNRTTSWETMSDCHWTERSYLDFMGYKMRTANYSVTQWFKWDGPTLRPDFDTIVGVELYSHVGDTGMAPAAYDDFENENLAGNPDYSALEKELRARQVQEIKRWLV